MKITKKVRQSGGRLRLWFHCCFAEKVAGHLSPWCDSNRWQKVSCNISRSICKSGKRSTYFWGYFMRFVGGVVCKDLPNVYIGNSCGLRDQRLHNVERSLHCITADVVVRSTDYTILYYYILHNTGLWKYLYPFAYGTKQWRLNCVEAFSLQYTEPLTSSTLNYWFCSKSSFCCFGGESSLLPPSGKTLTPILTVCIPNVYWILILPSFQIASAFTVRKHTSPSSIVVYVCFVSILC